MTTPTSYRELDHRTADGLAVTLEWNPATEALRVVVVDRDRDAVRAHRSASVARAIDGHVRIAQKLGPRDRQRGQRDGARTDSNTAARLAASRHISSPILGGGVRVAQAARREGFTNTTKTEEVSK